MGILFLLDSKGSGPLLFLNKIVGAKDRVKAYLGIKEHIISSVTAKEYEATTVTRGSRRILTSIKAYKETL